MWLSSVYRYWSKTPRRRVHPGCYPIGVEPLPFTIYRLPNQASTRIFRSPRTNAIVPGKTVGEILVKQNVGYALLKERESD